MPLRLSPSCPHQYYLGDYQGTLQYKKEKTEILDLDFSTIHENNETDGYHLEYHTEENLCLITPDTPNGRQDWKIILMMKK